MDDINSNQYDTIKDIVKGVFSEEVGNIVRDAPSDRMLIYAFLVIAIVLILSLVVILKISSNSANRAIKESVHPYIEKLSSFQNSFERSQNNYEIMSNKFHRLVEEMAKQNSMRIGEEDKIDMVMKQIDSLCGRINDNIVNVQISLRDHEKGSYERQLEIQRFNYEVRLHIMGANYKKDIIDRMIEKGLVEKEQVDEIVSEIIKK